MNKKNKPNQDGFVYSTNPDFEFEKEQHSLESIPPSEQKLRVRLETKHRAGKAVTLITGFSGNDKEFQDLGKKLKTYCGTGGSAKDGEMIIQGDQRDKVLQWLLKNGYKQAKKI